MIYVLDEQQHIVAYLGGLQAKVMVLRELQVKSGEELSALLLSVLDRAFKGELWPPLSFGHLPKMPNCTEFGENSKHKVGMNIFVNAQVEIVLPPFSFRCFSRNANGGS